MKKVVTILAILSTVFVGLMSTYFFVKSYSNDQCEQLVNVTRSSKSMGYIKSHIIDAISNKGNLELIASVGGDVYSHELPTTFSKLELGIVWSSLEVESTETYIAIAGNWWDTNGVVNPSAITLVSIGTGPRQYIVMSISGSDLIDFELLQERLKVVHQGEGYKVICAK